MFNVFSSDSRIAMVIVHSYKIVSIGFLVSAFNLCQLTVNRAITGVIMAARKNIDQFKLVL